jgi:hypothetical protein
VHHELPSLVSAGPGGRCGTDGRLWPFVNGMGNGPGDGSRRPRVSRARRP